MEEFEIPSCEHWCPTDCGAELASLLVSRGCKLPLRSGDPFTDLMNLNILAFKYLSGSNSAKGFPDGNWYMVTVTTPVGLPESHCMEIHECALSYFRYQGIKVAHAVLEKESMYHVHYAVNMPTYNKNCQRDLSKACNGYRVKIESKVTSLLKWNGLCLYLFKPEGHEKAHTRVRTLIDGISRVEGQGYVLKTK